MIIFFQICFSICQKKRVNSYFERINPHLSTHFYLLYLILCVCLNIKKVTSCEFACFFYLFVNISNNEDIPKGIEDACRRQASEAPEHRWTI